MLFATLFLGLLATSAFAYPSEERIVGGRPANEGEVPYIVSIRLFEKNAWSVICSGSILTKRHILSAAHCFKYPNEPNRYRIQFGQIDKFSPLNVIDVESVANHENYTSAGLRPADIAVLKLADDIEFSLNEVEPVELANGPLNIKGDSVNSVLAGWGRDQNDQKVRLLKIASFPLFNDQLCRKYMGGSYRADLHICAGSLDGSQKQCSGDSGGPLMVNGQQQGVVSWSVKPCTIANAPGIFTRVWTYIRWINNKVRTM